MIRKTPVSIAVPLALFCGFQTLQGAVFKVDFNTTNSGGYPDGASAWNIYAADTNLEGTAANLSDTSGSASAGITLLAEGSFSDSGNGATNGFDNSTGGPSWLTTDGSLGNTAAAGDYFFTSTAATFDSFTLTLANLVPGNIASLDLWMSRTDSNPEGYYEYSVDSGANWLGFQVLDKSGTLVTTSGWDTNDTATTGQPFLGNEHGNDNAWYMNANGITIGSTGDLLIRVTDSNNVTGRDWSGLSAFQLTVVPEPSAALLSILGGLLLVGKRSR